MRESPFRGGRAPCICPAQGAQSDIRFVQSFPDKAAWRIFDLDGRTSRLWTTADFVYLRLHGSDGPYVGSYDDDALHDWSRMIRAWQGEGRSVYCYFDNDNDTEAQAPGDARRLIEMLG